MKKTATLFAGLIVTFAIQGQTLSPTVVSSTGGYTSNANGSLSYTVGEMTMVETFSANGNILTQGFQQPNDKVTAIIDLTQDEFGSFVVYPNPAIDNLSFGFQFPESGKVQVMLYDVLGQKINDLYNANYTEGKIIQQINVSTLAASLYFLNLHFTKDSNGKEYTVSKKFNVIN